jgi:ribosomal protein L29
MNKDKAILKNLDVAQLEEKVQEYRTNLFKLRLASTTGHVKDFSQFKKLRAGLARALTYISQKTQS